MKILQKTLSKPYKKPTLESLKPSYAKHEWPCPTCLESGIIVDPDATPDVVEGYKMSRRIKCPTCFGTKHVNKNYYDEWLKIDIKKWKYEESERKRIQKELKLSFKKISEEDFEKIKEYIESRRPYPNSIRLPDNLRTLEIICTRVSH